jgi:elongation factor Ts
MTTEVKITAEAVKQLRERTGAGMMECKKALVETGGDLEAAAELMRKQGLTKADKKAARVAAEGIIMAAVSVDKRSAALLEVNSETDFVARQNEFLELATQSADLALNAQPKSLEDLLSRKLPGGETVDERRRAMVAKIGENITVRRFDRLEAPTVIGSYVHGTRIGVLVGLEKGDEALAREIAMHVAAMSPEFVSPADAPADLMAKEREIFTEQAQNENAASDKPKPADIVTRMVEGRLRKRMSEIALLGQPYVKEPDITVEQLLQRTGARVTGFRRFEVGEGIEKKQADFASEVEAAVRSASQ